MMLSRLYLEKTDRNAFRLKFRKGSPKGEPQEGRIVAPLLSPFKTSHQLYWMGVVTCEMKYGRYLKAHGGSTGTMVSGMSLNSSPAILEPCCLWPGTSTISSCGGWRHSVADFTYQHKDAWNYNKVSSNVDQNKILGEHYILLSVPISMWYVTFK